MGVGPIPHFLRSIAWVYLRTGATNESISNNNLLSLVLLSFDSERRGNC